MLVLLVTISNIYVHSLTFSIISLAQLDSAEEARPAAKKLNHKKPSKSLSLDSDASFLEAKTKQTLTDSDIAYALLFDASFIDLYHSDVTILGNLQAYCNTPLRMFFMDYTFPTVGGVDHPLHRASYISDALWFYSTIVYDTLLCDF